MTEIINEETAEQANFYDLTEEDKQKIRTHNFSDFKKEIPLDRINLRDALMILQAVRNYLENTMLVSYNTIKNAHQKMMWVNQKLHDLYAVNSALLYKESVIKEKQNKAFEAAGKVKIVDQGLEDGN